jgi:hypothetical protein
MNTRLAGPVVRPKQSCLLIAALLVFCTPTVALAQGVVSTGLDAATSTSGTDPRLGNYIYPSGGYSLSAKGGAQIELISITAELQFQKAGVWTSFNPPQRQTATTKAGTWQSDGWAGIQSGYYYRVDVVMIYQYKLNAGDPWTKATTENDGYTKLFP